MTWDRLNTAALARAGLLVVCLLLTAISVPVFGQSLTLLTTINFGRVDFNGTPLTGDVSMGTDGTITYGGNTDGPGLGTPGSVEIGGTGGTVVDIRCAATATLALGGGTVTMDPIRINIGSGQSYASGIDCQGIGTTVVGHSLTGNAAQNTVFIGGRLTLNGSSPQSGEYSSVAGSGSSMALRVVVQ